MRKFEKYDITTKPAYKRLKKIKKAFDESNETGLRILYKELFYANVFNSTTNHMGHSTTNLQAIRAIVQEEKILNASYYGKKKISALLREEGFIFHKLKLFHKFKYSKFNYLCSYALSTGFCHIYVSKIKNGNMIRVVQTSKSCFKLINKL